MTDVGMKLRVLEVPSVEPIDADVAALAAAWTAYEQELSVAEADVGKDHPRVVTILVKLAEVQHTAGLSQSVAKPGLTKLCVYGCGVLRQVYACQAATMPKAAACLQRAAQVTAKVHGPQSVLSAWLKYLAARGAQT